MSNESPFHEGEQAVQRQLGVQADIEPWARKVIRPFLPPEHQAFYAKLPFLVAAARDEEGRPWATLLAGSPGFATSHEPGSLSIEATPAAGDALDGSLRPGSELGLLGIELATRRRNRLNGRVAATNDDGALLLEVGQSFGNCPQYIVEREWRRAEPGAAPRAERHSRLTPALRARIEQADTFFIASGHRGEGERASFGMDASHRGGEPGFVRVESDSRLSFPDYAGNNHFNTIGNLVVDPRVGLLFVDFERGSLLQLSGRAEIDWDSPAVSAVPGARRLVAVEIDAVIELENALPIRWQRPSETLRALRVVEATPQSDDVTSFVLEAPDGARLPDFEPGQHLPIELEVPGEAAPVRRTYSLSNEPGSDRYRITVKREPSGRASSYLHDFVSAGDTLRSSSPAGDFVLRAGSRPVVLVSAGVGVTPMLSMLGALTNSEDSRQVTFIHGARDGRHHPLAREARELASRRGGVRVHVSYSQPGAEDVLGRDYDALGRVDAELVSTLSGQHEADYYLCGPTRFMADIQTALEARGVAPERIHSESFGPVG